MQFNCMVLDMHPYVGLKLLGKNENIYIKDVYYHLEQWFNILWISLVATNCVNFLSYGYDRLIHQTSFYWKHNIYN